MKNSMTKNTIIALMVLMLIAIVTMGCEKNIVEPQAYPVCDAVVECSDTEVDTILAVYTSYYSGEYFYLVDTFNVTHRVPNSCEAYRINCDAVERDG